MKQLALNILVGEIPFSREVFNRILGFGRALPPHFEDVCNKVSAALEHGTATCQALIFEGKEFQTEGDTIRIQDTVFDVGENICNCFRNCEGAALFVCTMGMEFEHNMKSFSDPIEAYFADTVGSLKCEALADLVQDNIALTVQDKGFFTTNRYSPGYCQWRLDEQQKLFSFFSHSQTGVRITASSLMIPVKSISALLGLGRNLIRLPYSCADCADTNCLHRK